MPTRIHICKPESPHTKTIETIINFINNQFETRGTIYNCYAKILINHELFTLGFDEFPTLILTNHTNIMQNLFNITIDLTNPNSLNKLIQELHNYNTKIT